MAFESDVNFSNKIQGSQQNDTSSKLVSVTTEVKRYTRHAFWNATHPAPRRQIIQTADCGGGRGDGLISCTKFRLKSDTAYHCYFSHVTEAIEFWLWDSVHMNIVGGGVVEVGGAVGFVSLGSIPQVNNMYTMISFGFPKP